MTLNLDLNKEFDEISDDNAFMDYMSEVGKIKLDPFNTHRPRVTLRMTDISKVLPKIEPDVEFL